MQRNFDYIKDMVDDKLYRYCAQAEETQVGCPEVSAVSARNALEYLVRSIYLMKHIEMPPRATLVELIDGEPFADFIGDAKVMMAIHYIRKVGNHGAHAMEVKRSESFFSLLNLYNVVTAVLLKLTVIKEVRPFDKNLIPNGKTTVILTPTTVTVEPTDKVVATVTETVLEDTTPVKALDWSGISEAETRRLFIDLMLKEAGWDVLEKEGTVIPSKACIEVQVEGMPNNQGIGFADYVLFGSNGLPLAVVEAKRTSVSPVKGKHQAELYADCLEKRYGVRPVIYYSNGFETYIIDGLGYPARRLYGFHTENELELLIQQRGRKDITDLTINDNITNRYYQKTAVKAVCEHFNKKHRKGLLVMATGTGKTRVSISLVDVLMRNGWVKNVLFLADRTSLVSQAKKNFVKLLPNTTTCVLSEKGDHDTNARIIFSTYQTMINYIDTDDKAMSVGKFDLIIIDEAHRSIFGRYGAIFHYFDAMLVGLTATPRDQVDRSTYQVFGMEEGQPNYAYELEDAVQDGFLVNYTGLKRGTMILKEGIKYDDLSAKQREQLEQVWEYEAVRKALNPQDCHRDIQENEIFSYIFNIDTIDKVLQDLMEHGLKVQSGERIGKTIIFAYNHRHAEMIVDRFNSLYPEYSVEEEFCSLIDNYVPYAQDLIDKFEIRDKAPQIAVSVDMLDTGIDVPDVLNLVFFKIVKSRIKFDQMIGRGTRLSADIYGAGKDKERFLIFDWCRNFEFFSKNPEGQEARATQSLTERLFCLRTDIAFLLQRQEYQSDDYCKGLHDNVKAGLCGQVQSLKDSHISVRMKWEQVSHFREEKAWEYISDVDTLTLKNDVSPLLPKSLQDENAKKFDVLVLVIEVSLLDSKVNAKRSIQQVQMIAQKLQEVPIPQVMAKKELIAEVVSPVAWENVSLRWLEKVRVELRELIRFLVGQGGRSFTVDIEDVVSYDGEEAGVPVRVTYKQSVLDYLATNHDLPVFRKIYEMEQLTSDDVMELERILWKELGSKEDYEKFTSGMMCGANVAIFIRSLIGVDRSDAVKRFSDFISGSMLNSEQEAFISDIISYVCENGDITKEIVVNDAPFDEHLSVFLPYMQPLAQYIDCLHNVVIPAYGHSSFSYGSASEEGNDFGRLAAEISS